MIKYRTYARVAKGVGSRERAIALAENVQWTRYRIFNRTMGSSVHTEYVSTHNSVSIHYRHDTDQYFFCPIGELEDPSPREEFTADDLVQLDSLVMALDMFNAVAVKEYREALTRAIRKLKETTV